MSAVLAIVGFGAHTAVGLDARQTCAALRAGIAGFAESGFYYQMAKIEPIMGAAVPTLPSPQQGSVAERLATLVLPALAECLRAATVSVGQIALLLAIREPYRADALPLDEPWLRLVQHRLGVRFHLASRLLAEGHAAVFRGLRLARTLLAEGAVQACVVGGVDSYLNAVDLDRYETVCRLKSPRIAQGFIPGEGAAFVLVATPGTQAAQRPLGYVLGVGSADETPTATVLVGGSPSGKGLQRALEGAVTDAQVAEAWVQFRVSDLNGEHYRGLESLLALSRFYRTHREQLEIWHPADCVGDIGAASGALSLIAASIGIAKGYAPGDVAMCEASSDSGARAACLVHVPPALRQVPG